MPSAEESGTFFARAKQFYSERGPSDPSRYPMFMLMSLFFSIAAAGIPSPGVMVFALLPYIIHRQMETQAPLPDLTTDVMQELFQQAFYTSPEACFAALALDSSLVLISSKGRVCRLVNGEARIYTPDIGEGKFYAQFQLHGTAHAVHRVVAASFLFMFNLPGYVVDHIDRNKKNNDLSNLRCVSVAENNRNRGWTASPERAVKCCTYRTSRPSNLRLNQPRLAESLRSTLTSVLGACFCIALGHIEKKDRDDVECERCDLVTRSPRATRSDSSARRAYVRLCWDCEHQCSQLRSQQLLPPGQFSYEWPELHGSPPWQTAERRTGCACVGWEETAHRGLALRVGCPAGDPRGATKSPRGTAVVTER
jgi:hypothetical protein